MKYLAGGHPGAGVYGMLKGVPDIWSNCTVGETKCSYLVYIETKKYKDTYILYIYHIMSYYTFVIVLSHTCIFIRILLGFLFTLFW